MTSPWHPDRGNTLFIRTPIDMPLKQIAMLQTTIHEAWAAYGGDPHNAEQFWNFLVGNGVADVPRETFPFQVDVVYRVNGGALRAAQRTVRSENWTYAVEQVRSYLTEAFPRDVVTFCKFSGGGAMADGGSIVSDVPRETSTGES